MGKAFPLKQQVHVRSAHIPWAPGCNFKHGHVADWGTREQWGQEECFAQEAISTLSEVWD